jgi:hypothetical protein
MGSPCISRSPFALWFAFSCPSSLVTSPAPSHSFPLPQGDYPDVRLTSGDALNQAESMPESLAGELLDEELYEEASVMGNDNEYFRLYEYHKSYRIDSKFVPSFYISSLFLFRPPSRQDPMLDMQFSYATSGHVVLTQDRWRRTVYLPVPHNLHLIRIPKTRADDEHRADDASQPQDHLNQLYLYFRKLQENEINQNEEQLHALDVPSMLQEGHVFRDEDRPHEHVPTDMMQPRSFQLRLKDYITPDQPQEDGI